jgi:hypothetical protein
MLPSLRVLFEDLLPAAPLGFALRASPLGYVVRFGPGTFADAKIPTPKTHHTLRHPEKIPDTRRHSKIGRN